MTQQNRHDAMPRTSDVVAPPSVVTASPSRLLRSPRFGPGLREAGRGGVWAGRPRGGGRRACARRWEAGAARAAAAEAPLASRPPRAAAAPGEVEAAPHA